MTNRHKEKHRINGGQDVDDRVRAFPVLQVVHLFMLGRKQLLVWQDISLELKWVPSVTSSANS